MYKVLIVDDETIILSGIKFLIDWEEHDCTIVDTARNGKVALEKIRKSIPDIVLCDINMPVMTGIDLLKIVNEEFPYIVFIMLTSLQEFQLVQKSMQYKAVDYLLKTQLEPESLKKSLDLAKEECQKRSSLMQIETTNYINDLKQKENLSELFFNIIFDSSDKIASNAINSLLKNNMLNRFGMLYIPLDFSQMSYSASNTYHNKKKTIAWIKEIASDLSDYVFGSNFIFVPTDRMNCLIMFVWENDFEWKKRIGLLEGKLSKALEEITQVQSCIYSTKLYIRKEDLLNCREELLIIIEYYYLNSDILIKGVPTTHPIFEPLELSGISIHLQHEVNIKNAAGCVILLDNAIQQLTQVVHQKSQAIWFCNDLVRNAKKVMPNESMDEKALTLEINSLMTLTQVIHFIERFKNTISAFIKVSKNEKSDPVELAKQYVLENIENRISLPDVAKYVSISAGYLSTLFKKQYHQNFVDYINEEKSKHACKLISENKYSMYEISYKLGFENAYYFSRIFKRYIGMTPSEYQKELKKENT